MIHFRRGAKILAGRSWGEVVKPVVLKPLELWHSLFFYRKCASLCCVLSCQEFIQGPRWRTISRVYQYVLHKAGAEVSKIANYRRLVAVNHAPQSKSTDGSRSSWRQRSIVAVVIVVGVVVVVQ